MLRYINIQKHYGKIYLYVKILFIILYFLLASLNVYIPQKYKYN
jgi:hypothetical protein